MRLKNPLLLLFVLTLFTIRASAQCVATIAPTVQVPCYSTTDTLTANYAAGSSYQWYYSLTNGTSYTPVSGATARTYPTLLSGYYKVSVTNGSCHAMSNPFYLAFDVPVTPIISLTGTDTICPGQTVVISASTGSQITYQWMKDGQNIAGANGTSILADSNGNYSVVTTDPYGCIASSSLVAIAQRSAPVPQLIPGSQVTVCDSLTTTLFTHAYPSAAYTWLKYAGGRYNPIPGATGNNYTATAPGTSIYEVTATYSNGCIETSAPVTATFSTTPAAPVVVSNSPVCLSYQLNLNITNTIPGYIYTCYGPNNFTAALQNPIQNPVRIINAPSDSGSYMIQVSNNGCLNAAVVDVAVTCTDSVWPGDVNADYVVNNYDALDLALAWNYTGNARSNISTADTAYFCADWGNNILPGVNTKHADCNGDGKVDSTDVAAIYANYGDVHAKTFQSSAAKKTGVPDLYFDLTNIPHLRPGDSVSIPIKLGSVSTPMYNILGLAANIKVLGLTLTSPPTITYPESWLGGAGNTLRFAELNAGNNPSANSIGWAYVRTNHLNTSGQGTIANLNFVVPQGVGINSWVFLYLDNVTIIDNSGATITAYNVVDDTTVINPTAISTITSSADNFATVAPNPSAPGAQAYLQTDLATPATLTVSVADITGRQVWQHSAYSQQGKQNLPLPTNVNTGIYLIHIQRSNDNFVQVLKWLKN